MKPIKVQSHSSLKREITAVASGDKPAPADAGGASFASLDALLTLLTPQNCMLLAMVREVQPQSIAELAVLTERTQSSLTRTLGKLEAAGFVCLQSINGRKLPTAVRSLRINIGPVPETGAGDHGQYPPLTPEHLGVIAKHAPKRRTKAITSELLL